MRILVVYSESPFWDEALCFADKLCTETGSSCVLLGVAPEPALVPALSERISESLPVGTEKSPVIRHGDFYQQVLGGISDDAFDLVLVGADPLDTTPLQHVATAEYLALLCPIPLAIVQSCPKVWDQMLICARSPNPTLSVIQAGKRLASLIKAETEILHVAPPRQERTRKRKKDTIPGVQVRHGTVQEEVEAEINAKEYGIVVVGAHKVPAVAPSTEITLALPDITHQLIQLAVPVIVVVGQSIPQLEVIERPLATHENELAKLVRYAAIELVLYAVLIVGYAAVAFQFLGTILNDLFYDNMVLYAIVALALIIGQGVLLDGLTSFLLDRLRLERFD